MTIDIIGAGIGGLSTALTLQKKGIAARVYEQAPTLKPVGAGIVLANNAMQVYRKLGIQQQVEEVGNLLSKVQLTDANLNPLSSVSLKYFEEKYQVRNLAIHRGALQQVLLDQLKDTKLFLDHKVKKLSIQEEQITIDFENGKQITPKYVIGADGIHSAVREGLLGKIKLRNAQQLCWRGVLDFELPTTRQSEINEAWGDGVRFGFVQIAPKKVYWFAVKSITANKSSYPIEQLGALFTNFHPLVQEVIAATPTKSIHTDELWDLAPISKWQGHNICLLGDAAHATTPNMGQGACQAIEGAYVLAECMAKYDWPTAFEKYQQLRLAKAHHVVKTSWTVGKMAHWQNPIATTIRNRFMRMLPEKMSLKQMESLFELEI